MSWFDCCDIKKISKSSNRENLTPPDVSFDIETMFSSFFSSNTSSESRNPRNVPTVLCTCLLTRSFTLNLLLYQTQKAEFAAQSPKQQLEAEMPSIDLPPMLKRRASLTGQGQNGRRGSTESVEASPTARDKRRGSNDSITSPTTPGNGRRRSSTDSTVDSRAPERPRRKSADEVRYFEEVKMRSRKSSLDRLKNPSPEGSATAAPQTLRTNLLLSKSAVDPPAPGARALICASKSSSKPPNPRRLRRPRRCRPMWRPAGGGSGAARLAAGGAHAAHRHHA